MGLLFVLVLFFTGVSADENFKVERPGCLPVDTRIRCIWFNQKCKSDSDCKKGEICCPNACGTQCTANICSLPKQPGTCKAYIPSYFYNSVTQKCDKFIYGGCGGNDNRFTTLDLCNDACNPDNICELPPDSGPCEALVKRFYYDISSNTCRRFNYGGCKGNKNNFKSKRLCKRACGHSVCSLPKDPGQGRAHFKRYYYNSITGKCEQFIFGGGTGNGNNFKSKRACRRTCEKKIRPRPPVTKPPPPPTTNPVCQKGKPLYRDCQGLGGKPCPSGYFCSRDRTNSKPVCCQIPCKDGRPHPTATCSQFAGSTCPAGYSCLGGPADEYFACCPVRPEVKPGSCPPNRKPPNIACAAFIPNDSCRGDNSCPGKKKCCVTWCYPYCVDPEPTLPPPSPPPPSPVCQKGKPLYRDCQGLGGKPCPSGYFCSRDPTNSKPVCCQIPCKYGKPHPTATCSQFAGSKCPAGYSCLGGPADEYFACCPVNPGPLPPPPPPPRQATCDIGSPLPNVFCGRGPNRQDCPFGYYCNIDPGDRFAVCCRVCKSGNPHPTAMCGIVPCPSGYSCAGGPGSACCPKKPGPPPPPSPPTYCKFGAPHPTARCGIVPCPKGYSCGAGPGSVCCPVPIAPPSITPPPPVQSCKIGKPLPSIRCGGNVPCPSEYFCAGGPGSVCCPSGGPPPAPSICKFGKPHPTSLCDPAPCPPGYSCSSGPGSPCCPIEPKCKFGNPHPKYVCGIVPCPPGYSCASGPGSACCPIQPNCKYGKPHPTEKCGIAPCPPGYSCTAAGPGSPCCPKKPSPTPGPPTPPPNKPGVCPEPQGAGICVEMCSNDGDCQGRLKCCSNGCGHTCQTPILKYKVDG